MNTYDQTESRVCGCGRRIPVGRFAHVGRCYVDGRPASMRPPPTFRRIDTRNGALFECPTCGRVRTADEIMAAFEALRPAIVRALEGNPE